jgi:phosphatidylserine synthase
MDKYNNYNILAYILGATSFLGIIRYPEIPVTWWLVIGLIGGLILLYSNIKYRNTKYLTLDVVNIIIIFIVIQVLPQHIGIYLNILVAVLVLALLFIKAKILEKVTSTQ